MRNPIFRIKKIFLAMVLFGLLVIAKNAETEIECNCPTYPPKQCECSGSFTQEKSDVCNLHKIRIQASGPECRCNWGQPQECCCNRIDAVPVSCGPSVKDHEITCFPGDGSNNGSTVVYLPVLFDSYGPVSIHRNAADASGYCT